MPNVSLAAAKEGYPFLSNPDASPITLRVSVIIPVHRGGEAFIRCLQGLSRLDPPPLEILVVVDGGDDGSSAAARQAGAQVLHMPKRVGPARARNAGARESRGEILLFLDADVVPAPSVVGQVVTTFRKDPGLSALIGSYDDSPSAPSFLSQYRNLLHHYVHQQSRRRVHIFWGACGAVRRQAFFQADGFDESYDIPAMEDVELGYRLSRAGHRIELDKQLQVRHLKHWSAGNMLRTDIFQRAIPWTRLLLTMGRIYPELNLGPNSRFSAVLTWVLFVCLCVTCVWPPALYGTAAAVLGLLRLNGGFYRFLGRSRGWWFTARALPWHWLYYLYASAAFGYVVLFERRRKTAATGDRPWPT